MYICTLLLFEFVDTITLMDMDIDYSFYVAYASWPLWLLARLPLFFFFFHLGAAGLHFPGHSMLVVMIILIILMRHFMSRNGIEIEWSVTASS